MLPLVAVLWCVYLSDCFARHLQGGWTIRGRTGRMRGVRGPDFQLFGGRVELAWTPVLPWHLAFAVGGADCSVKAARVRLDEVHRDLRWLRVASAVLFAWLMIVFPLLVVTETLLPVIRVWLAIAIGAWAIALPLFIRSYRKVHGRPPAFETWLTVALSPISLMRAPSAVTLSAASRLHPVAAAAVLCDDDELSRIARLVHYDCVGDRAQIEAAMRQRRVLDRLTAGPASWEPGVSQFCPRCHSTYTSAAMGCGDCDGVTLRSLGAPAVEHV
jgi:hypothetical protein